MEVAIRVVNAVTPGSILLFQAEQNYGSCMRVSRSTAPRRHVKFGSKPATNLFLDMADRLGIQRLERFGDSTGRLGDI